ncbi:MAG TPA: energy transducer TonB [Opitutaceae bacterium]|nr:energy transducer TonB [Opitutaceae bacterium]
MKTAAKLAVLLSLGVLAVPFASAKTPEQAYLETCRKDPGVPVPLTVVSPMVSGQYIGTAVQLEFVVDATGKPVDVSVTSPVDGALASAVVDAVKQWRFKPAMRDGAPVAAKVVLPVKIIDDTSATSAYAMK